MNTPTDAKCPTQAGGRSPWKHLAAAKAWESGSGVVARAGPCCQRLRNTRGGGCVKLRWERKGGNFVRMGTDKRTLNTQAEQFLQERSSRVNFSVTTGRMAARR